MLSDRAQTLAIFCLNSLSSLGVAADLTVSQAGLSSGVRLLHLPCYLQLHNVLGGTGCSAAGRWIFQFVEEFLANAEECTGLALPTADEVCVCVCMCECVCVCVCVCVLLWSHLQQQVLAALFAESRAGLILSELSHKIVVCINGAYFARVEN